MRDFLSSHRHSLPCRFDDGASAALDRILRRLSVLRPLDEQRELGLRPIGSSRWHGGRPAIAWREHREDTLGMVRIRHEGIVVQLYAQRLHVRNIDIPKQRSY